MAISLQIDQLIVTLALKKAQSDPIDSENLIKYYKLY